MPQEIFLICASAGNLSTSLKISVISFFRLTQFVGDKPSDGRTLLGKEKGPIPQVPSGAV